MMSSAGTSCPPLQIASARIDTRTERSPANRVHAAVAIGPQGGGGGLALSTSVMAQFPAGSIRAFSIRTTVGVAPVLAGTKLLVAAVVAPHAARGLVVGRHEAV